MDININNQTNKNNWKVFLFIFQINKFLINLIGEKKVQLLESKTKDNVDLAGLFQQSGLQKDYILSKMEIFQNLVNKI